MRRFLLLGFFLLAFAPPDGPFVKTYKAAPLATVLRDLEAHFSLQILYRPQDIANAPSFTGSINTSDYQAALRQVLGMQLTFTVSKKMVVITAVPPQKTQPKPQTNPSAQTKAPPRPTTSQGKPQMLVQQKPTVMQPQEKVSVSQEETSNPRVADITDGNDLVLDSDSVMQETGNTPKVVYNPPTFVALLPKEWPDTTFLDAPNFHRQLTIPQQISLEERPRAFRHLFHSAVSIGYGSEMMARLDLRYGFCFHKHWGVGGGINFAYAAKRDQSGWLEEGRIGLPVTFSTRWPLSPKWGIHATVGAMPSFAVYSGRSGAGISDNNVDVLPFVEVDAAHPISKHINLLIGLYSKLSALSVSPWSIGVNVGIEIGGGKF